jgi:2-keto-4-pentenoate hydratase
MSYELIASGNSLGNAGADVLGSPLLAITWLANEMSEFGFGLETNQIITTGASAPPVPVETEDSVTADFETLGTVSVKF